MRRCIAILAMATMALAACSPDGIAWGDGAFASNGERIYFTATSERGTDINYSGGPASGGMMMGGRFSCASCHGVNATGGVHTMGMARMDAPDIRWATLGGHGADLHLDEDNSESHEGDETTEPSNGDEYDFETFRRAVVEGSHPDGKPLGDDMPRWEISEDDLIDLADYLQSLPAS